MSSDYKNYPRGRVSMGGGDLQDATEVQVKLDNGEKNVGTLRNATAGSAEGEHTEEMSWKGVLSEDGFERDYYGKWRKRQVTQARMKVPGKTYVCTGRFKTLNFISNKDGAIEFDCTLIGGVDEA